MHQQRVCAPLLAAMARVLQGAKGQAARSPAAVAADATVAAAVADRQQELEVAVPASSAPLSVAMARVLQEVKG